MAGRGHRETLGAGNVLEPGHADTGALTPVSIHQARQRVHVPACVTFPVKKPTKNLPYSPRGQPPASHQDFP